MLARVLLGLALASAVCPGQTETITFRLKTDFLPPSSRQGKKLGEIVELTLPGHTLNPAIDVPIVSRTAVDRGTPEGTLRSMRSANLAGDADWIADNFAPQDQDRLRKLFADPAAVQKSRTYYASVSRMQIIEILKIRQYTILVVRTEGSEGKVTRPVPMLQTPQGWKATNDLAADPTLDFVWMCVVDIP